MSRMPHRASDGRAPILRADAVHHTGSRAGSKGSRAARGLWSSAVPGQMKRSPFHVEDRSRSEIPAPFHAGPTARAGRHSPTRHRLWTACRSSRHAPRRAFIRAKGGEFFPPAADAPRRAYRTHKQKKPKEIVLGLLHVVVVAGAGFEPTAFGL